MSTTTAPSTWSEVRFLTQEEDLVVILKANVSSCVSLQKRHKADNTVNKKKTTGIKFVPVNVRQLFCTLFHECACVYLWGFVFTAD